MEGLFLRLALRETSEIDRGIERQTDRAWK